MELLRLVLVDTEGSINLGMILRLAANFAVDEIYLASERTYNEEEVFKYAVRASNLYSSVVRVKTLEEALNGCDIRVCTTAKAREEDVLRNTVSSEDLPNVVSSYRRVCLVFGRESTGLTREELAACDISSTIPSSESYPALNLANSVAIFLYELFTKLRKGEQVLKKASREELEEAISAFSRISRQVMSDERKIKAAERAFRHFMFKSSPSSREAKIVTHVLRRAVRRLDSCHATQKP